MRRPAVTALRAPLALTVAALVLALGAAPASAVPTGTLTITSTQVRSTTAYAVGADLGITTDCPSGSSCGSWYGVVTTVAANRDCSPSGSGAWVGPVTQGASEFTSTVWEERAPGQRKACLYLYESAGRALVAEAVYDPPPGVTQPAPASTDPYAGLTTEAIPANLGRQGKTRFRVSLANLPGDVRRERWLALADTTARRWGLRSVGTTPGVVRPYDRRNTVGFGETRGGILGVQRDSYLIRRTRGVKRCTRRNGVRTCRYVRSQVLSRVLIDQDVTLNRRVAWQEGPNLPGDDEYDLQSVLVHELGHMAGNTQHVARCAKASSPMISSLGPGEWWRAPGDRFIAGDCTAGQARAAALRGRLARVTLTRTVWVR